jgi:hypothetical protein
MCNIHSMPKTVVLGYRMDSVSQGWVTEGGYSSL